MPLTQEEIDAAALEAAEAKTKADAEALEVTRLTEEAKKDEKRDWKKEAQDNASEAQKLRGRIRELSKADEDRKREEMTETEKLKADLEKATQEVALSRTKAVKAQVIATAATKGFADPNDAIGFLSLDEITDETDVSKLIDTLVKAKPYLLKVGDNGGKRLPNTGGRSPDGGGTAAEETEKAAKVATNFPGLRNILNRK